MKRIIFAFALAAFASLSFASSPFAYDAEALTQISNDPQVWGYFNGNIKSVTFLDSEEGSRTLIFTVNDTVEITKDRLLPDGSSRPITTYENRVRALKVKAHTVNDTPAGTSPGGHVHWVIESVEPVTPIKQDVSSCKRVLRFLVRFIYWPTNTKSS